MKYLLTGPPGLNLAANVLIGRSARGTLPQRRPLVLTSREMLDLMALLDWRIEGLRTCRRPPRRELKSLEGLRRKLRKV